MSHAIVTVSGFDPAGPFAGLILPDRLRKRQSETRFKQEWKIPRRLYQAMMSERYDMRARRWVSRARQRGTIIMSTMSTTQLGGQVVLTTHAFLDFAIDPSDTRSGVRFDADGGLTNPRLQLSQQTIAGEWWSDEPETGIGSSHEVRHLSSGKTGTYTAEAAAANAWITINANRLWDVFRGSTGTKQCAATFEVGLDGVESAIDSAVITVTATVEV